MYTITQTVIILALAILAFYLFTNNRKLKDRIYNLKRKDTTPTQKVLLTNNKIIDSLKSFNFVGSDLSLIGKFEKNDLIVDIRPSSYVITSKSGSIIDALALFDVVNDKSSFLDDYLDKIDKGYELGNITKSKISVSVNMADMKAFIIKRSKNSVIAEHLAYKDKYAHNILKLPFLTVDLLGDNNVELVSGLNLQIDNSGNTNRTVSAIVKHKFFRDSNNKSRSIKHIYKSLDSNIFKIEFKDGLVKYIGIN